MRLLLAVPALMLVPGLSGCQSSPLADSERTRAGKSGGTLPAACGDSSVSDRIEAVFKDPRFAAMKLVWGASVLELENGKEVFSHEPRKALIPASTLKLLTAATALRKLGPEYTFATEVLTTGTFRNGILEGDLYVKGGGDPSLVTERMELLAGQIRRAGLKKVKGRVFLDESALEPAVFKTARNPVDSDRAYNAPVSGLNFNYNAFTAFFKASAKRGAAPGIEIEPDVGWVRVTKWKNPDRPHSLDGIVARRVSADGFDRLEVASGERVASEVKPRTFNVSSPASYAGHAFLHALSRNGVRFAKAGFRSGITPSNATLLVRFEGLPLREIIVLMNKFSNNMIADTVVKTLGKLANGAPGTLAAGLDSMRESAEAWGWAPGSFQLRSGSGLDRDNRVSPEQLARLVRVVTLDLSLAPEFLSSLPIVGKDGTLRKKLGLLPEGAIVRAKGGSLDGVASLSGLAVDREGRKYVFAVLVNHPEAIHLNVGFWQELLVKALLGSC